MIILIEGNAKSLRLKSNLQKEFTAAVHLAEAPSSARFCIGPVGQAITKVLNLVTYKV